MECPLPVIADLERWWETVKRVDIWGSFLLFIPFFFMVLCICILPLKWELRLIPLMAFTAASLQQKQRCAEFFHAVRGFAVQKPGRPEKMKKRRRKGRRQRRSSTYNSVHLKKLLFLDRLSVILTGPPPPEALLSFWSKHKHTETSSLPQLIW